MVLVLILLSHLVWDFDDLIDLLMVLMDFVICLGLVVFGVFMGLLFFVIFMGVVVFGDFPWFGGCVVFWRCAWVWWCL